MIEKFFLIDSNILVYSLDKSENSKSEIAKKILKACIFKKKLLVVTNQILAEFFRVTTEKIEFPIPKTEMIKIITNIDSAEQFKKINYTTKTVFKAAQIAEEFNVDFWNSLIAATMLENNIFTIYTENVKDFKKIPGIRAINPFL